MPERHRRWRTLAVVAAASTTVAACSSSATSAARGSVATGRCPAGITIGFFGPLTGDSASLAINEYNGMKLAISQFNTANPGCQVKETHYDSEGSLDKVPPLARQAIDDKNTMALVGPALADESLTADALFNDAVLPIITPSATDPVLSKKGWKIFHRAASNDNAQGPAAAAYISKDLGAKKVAVVDDGSEYGRSVADIVRSKVTAAGGVVTSDQVDQKGSDFGSLVNKIKGAGAEAVFFGGYYQAAGVLARQLRAAGVSAKFVAPDRSDDPKFITVAGQAAAEGAVLTTLAAPVDKMNGGAEFSSAYRAAFGQDVGPYSMEAYDSANAILEAIKNGAATRRAVNDYLGTKTDWMGITKEMKFDSNGELLGTGSVYAYQVQDGKLVSLKPFNG